MSLPYVGVYTPIYVRPFHCWAISLSAVWYSYHCSELVNVFLQSSQGLKEDSLLKKAVMLGVYVLFSSQDHIGTRSSVLALVGLKPTEVTTYD